MKHISLEEGREMTYEALYKIVRDSEERKVTLDAQVRTYNPAFGLVSLALHPSSDNKVFGDDDDEISNSFHFRVYGQMMDWGKKPLIRENNLFTFLISDREGDFGPNHDGLGILSVERKGRFLSEKISKGNDTNLTLWILLILVILFVSTFLLFTFSR